MVTTTPPPELLALSENEQSAMEIYAGVKEARGDIDMDDPEEIAELASIMLNTVIHLGGIVERICTTPNPELPESVVTDEMARKACIVYEKAVNGSRAFIPNKRAIESMRAALQAVIPDVRAANARAEGLGADARRYRWLRENANTVNPAIQSMWANCKTAYPSQEEWDAAIDAAQAVRSEGDNDGR